MAKKYYHFNIRSTYIRRFSLKRFSLESLKTQTKVVTLDNQNRGRHSNEPIKAESKYAQPTLSAGKPVRETHNSLWFYL